MITIRLRNEILPGMKIPKPESKMKYKVKKWGMRRGSPALIYTIPNKNQPKKPSEKGVTDQEFDGSHKRLLKKNEFTSKWYKKKFPKAAKEDPCNFTTIGGIFELLGIAKYKERGVYVIKKK